MLSAVRFCVAAAPAAITERYHPQFHTIQCLIRPVTVVRGLGVWFDAELSISSQTCFCHLRWIGLSAVCRQLLVFLSTLLSCSSRIVFMQMCILLYYWANKMMMMMNRDVTTPVQFCRVISEPCTPHGTYCVYCSGSRPCHSCFLLSQSWTCIGPFSETHPTFLDSTQPTEIVSWSVIQLLEAWIKETCNPVQCSYRPEFVIEIIC